MKQRPTYHAVVLADGGPGGVMTHIMFVEELPFDIEVVALAGVDESRIEDNQFETDDAVIVNLYGNDDPEGWVWDGDSVATVSDNSELARTVFKKEER
jgi:hypothetical protein